MSDLSELVLILESALAIEDTSLIVRSERAVAEIHGPLTLRRGPEWLTLGNDEGSHAHVRTEDVKALCFRAPEGRGASLEVLGEAGTLLCKVSFRRTSPARPETYDRERAETLRARFFHLRERTET